MLPELPVLSVFLASVVALTLTPGPDMLYVMSRSIGQGRASGVLSAFGVIAGTFVHLGAAAIGLSELFRYSPLAFDIVRYAGAAFLLYLAWRAIRDGEDLATPRRWRFAGPAKVFLQGMLTNVLILNLADIHPFHGGGLALRRGARRRAMWDIGQAAQRGRRANTPHRRPPSFARRGRCAPLVVLGTTARPAPTRRAKSWR